MAINNTIITNWKKGIFEPVYLFEGNEGFFIDQLVHYAEHNILSESEASFNLSVFYGRDAALGEVVNACKRYPVFADKQVVILKEAQQFKDIAGLGSYMLNPLASTIFIIAYKEKKLERSAAFYKSISSKISLTTFEKVKDYKLAEWVQGFVVEKGLEINSKSAALIVEHIGNDLSRIENEIIKVSINLAGRKTITDDDIEKYIGISKEYNIYELQNAIARKDLPKAMNIVNYFRSNPKAAPLMLILPSIYTFFSKVNMLFSVQNASDAEVAAALGVNNFFLKDYRQAARLYGAVGVQNILLLLNIYNLKNLGVNSQAESETALLSEMIARMMV